MEDLQLIKEMLELHNSALEIVARILKKVIAAQFVLATAILILAIKILS